jgi:succinate dehydrogenase hydrophobic anchor subunit
MADSMWELNLYRWLITMFAALALVLAAIGLFGVMSYTVTARIREFAVRLALARIRPDSDITDAPGAHGSPDSV